MTGLENKPSVGATWTALVGDEVPVRSGEAPPRRKSFVSARRGMQGGAELDDTVVHLLCLFIFCFV